MSIKIAMVSLGCPKNQVDAEAMLFTLSQAGYTIGVEEAAADVVIVNTCGFIEEAKNEAIETILDVASLKNESLKALIVTGCLAERYRDEITEQIPEVDCVVGIGCNGQIDKIVADVLAGKTANRYDKKEALSLSGQRILGGYPFSAYLKIADGCDNCCTYCAIPMIRGRMRSRTPEDCVAEARRLAAQGVTELVVVAQDTTAYGLDLYGESRLPQLLSELCAIEGLRWIRTLYAYPEHITDELLQTIRREEKLVPYLDIPLQHCDGTVLSRMNRHGDETSLRELIARIRRVLPDVTLRTTLITGFPGETEEQFAALHAFVKEMKFDRLGCFAYSPEEDTPAAGFADQVDEQTKQDRMERIMNSQLEIVARANAAAVGQIREVLVEGYDDYIKCYFGRTAADAPEVDGKIFFTAPRALQFGEYVRVEVTDSIEYDLLGEMSDESAQ